MRALYMLLVACLAAASSAVAADIQFLSAKFDPSDANVRVSGQLFKPDGAGPHAAVVLLPSCGGLTRHVTYDWPQYLVNIGYVVLVVDTLGSRGYHQGCAAMRDRFATQARDAYGALDYLASQAYVDLRRIAAIGFSLGAISINDFIMLRAPRPSGNPEFKAFVSLYGRCRDMKPGAVRDAPLLQIIAEKDQYAQVCIERSKSIKMDTHVMPGAYHAFDSPEFTQIRSDPFGNQMLYDASTSEKARSLVRGFLEANLR